MTAFSSLVASVVRVTWCEHGKATLATCIAIVIRMYHPSSRVLPRVTVVNVRLQLLELARHLSANVRLNVLVLLGVGNAAFVRLTPESVNST